MSHNRNNCCQCGCGGGFNNCGGCGGGCGLGLFGGCDIIIWIIILVLLFNCCC